MDAYKIFKQAYRKYFLETPDFEGTGLISSADEIPTNDNSFKQVVIRAYVFLSTCKTRDIGHLKILRIYEKLMKRNQEGGMRTSPAEFATVLYILHHYCIRILRCSWRKDFFTMKAYNGFYQYTLRRTLTPMIIEEMLKLLGLEYDAVSNTFGFPFSSLNQSLMRNITEAGIGFFLSYTHCMAKNDRRFKENVTALTPLLQEPSEEESRSSSPAGIRNSLVRPSTSVMNDDPTLSRNGLSSHSNARPQEREHYRETDRLKHGSIAPPRNISVEFHSTEDRPVDSSVKNGHPYTHAIHRTRDRSAASSHVSFPGSDSFEDQYLYGAGENRNSGSYYTTHERLREKPPSVREPNGSSHSLRHIGMEMERCGVHDKPSLTTGFAHSLSHMNKSEYAGNGNENYVKFYQTPPRRGSPDGEMTKEPHTDRYLTSHSRSSFGRQSKRNAADRHIYEDINDR